MLCYALAIAIIAAIGYGQGRGGPFYGGLLSAAAIAAYHFTLIRDRDPQHCFAAFRHNNWIGASIFAGIAVDFLVINGGKG
jgi:4-hydroxybenzoate polyprenyltransferase